MNFQNPVVVNSNSKISTRRRWAFRFLYAAFLAGLVIAVLVISEVGVRLLVPVQVWSTCVAKDDWQADSELGWTNIPRLNVTNNFDGPAAVRFHLNADGLQPASATESRQPDQKRVMIFGDSATVGRAVANEERLATYLQNLLQNKEIKLDVICAGVQGYSTDQALLLMRRLLPRYRPDLVISMVCDNDFGGNESSVAYGLAKPRFFLSKGAGLQVTLPSKEAIDKNWKLDGGKSLAAYLQYSALYRTIRPALFRLRFGTDSDWKQANLIGGASAETQISMMTQADWSLFGALIGAMKKVCLENQAEFILTQHPHAWEAWDIGPTEDQKLWLHRRLLATATKADVRFCPVVPFFLEHRDEGPFHLLPRDPHCNGKGYEMTARCLAGFIESNQLLKPSR